MGTTTATAFKSDPHFNPSTEIDPRLASALRTWLQARDAAAALKSEATKVRKAETVEREARKEVADLFGGAPGSVELDGMNFTYDPTETGGGAPDYKAAWLALYGLMREAGGHEWCATMVQTLETYHTAPTIKHNLTAAPLEVPIPAPPPARVRRQGH